MTRISTSAAVRIRGLATVAVSATLLLAGGLAAAEDAPAPATQPATGCVRGMDLMTPEERTQHMAQMRGLSAQEHEKFMAAHHTAMQQRAAAKGQTLCSESMMGHGTGKGPHGPGHGMPPASDGAAPQPTN